MNSKIVILDDSVILYQHYISDEAWESVMAFPRGGLTYLIKNNNIKFYAYIDYFYRNCLMTMDLPIYIVDEEMGIDGEYDDIEEITEILNRIFPANDNGEGVDLTPYLKKREAEETYQPLGLYFDEVEYDSSGKTIDFYSDGALVDSIDATDFIKDGMVDQVELIELSGDTYLHIVFNTDAGKEPIDIPLGDLFDADNYYTKQETDDLLDDKLDASAYTPVDLTDYYTKKEVDDLIPEVPSLSGYATEQWVQNQGYINHIKTINNISLIGEGNIQIGSGGTIDAYTKAEADERFQPKGDYVTTTTFNTYILNLTQQITSLQEAIEACCSGQTGETLYRWVTLTGPNDYICSGTTKYAKEQKQQSTDNGATWQNVSPAEYRTGSAIETQSTDCGYTPEPQYRWKAAPTSDYLCIGTDKYYKVYYEVSYDNGVTWEHVVPEQTKRGNLIESASTDCGYIEYQYRWYQAPASDYMCSGTTKYYKEYYQVSTDGGNTWTNVSPTQTRQGSVIETQSTDCGYIAPQYRWQNAPNSDYICSGTTKYKKQYYQVSYDGGTTWQNVTPEQTRPGSVIETQSTDCGYEPTIEYRWVTVSGEYVCSGTTKYNKEKKQYRVDGGAWTDTDPLETRKGYTVIEAQSTDCGYDPNDHESHYLTFEVLENGTQFNYTKDVYYSTNKGVSWSKLTAGSNTSSMSAGSKIMWRKNIIDTLEIPGDFGCNGKRFNVEGNIMSIIAGDNFTGVTSTCKEDFGGMFKDLLVVSATNLVLPESDCMRCLDMFSGCTALTAAPALPSMTLASDCYFEMFKGCTALTTAPALPATTLSDWCYDGMFSGCTSLTTAPALPATALTESCYCNMFANCTSLTTAPVLSAKTVSKHGYDGMFGGCTSLNYIKCLATDISASYATNAWVYKVASSGRFVKASSMSGWPTGTSGIPSGWTIQNA